MSMLCWLQWARCWLRMVSGHNTYRILFRFLVWMIPHGVCCSLYNCIAPSFLCWFYCISTWPCPAAFTDSMNVQVLVSHLCCNNTVTLPTVLSHTSFSHSKIQLWSWFWCSRLPSCCRWLPFTIDIYTNLVSWLWEPVTSSSVNTSIVMSVTWMFLWSKVVSLWSNPQSGKPVGLR